MKADDFLKMIEALSTIPSAPPTMMMPRAFVYDAYDGIKILLPDMEPSDFIRLYADYCRRIDRKWSPGTWKALITEADSYRVYGRFMAEAVEANREEDRRKRAVANGEAAPDAAGVAEIVKRMRRQ